MSNTSPPGTDRILEAFRALVQAELDPLRYAGFFQYTITNVAGGPPDVLLDCEPTDDSLGLPSLTSVVAQPGISGITAIPDVGMKCVVIFLNRDPALPRYVGVESLGINPVCRVGDQVTVFLPPAIPVQGTVVIGGTPSPFAGVITVANPITGVSTQGSGKTYVG